MLRDTRKTAGYFEEYIACQMERIQKFEDVLRNLGANDTAKNMQCHMYLANFYQDLLLAEYSSGGSTGLLKRDCLKYLSHVCPQDSLPYDTAMNALAWAVLLDIRNPAILEDIRCPQDGMLEAFRQYLAGNWPLEDIEKMPVFSPSSEPFVRCLTGASSPEELRRYLESGWYESSRGAAWYESHTLDRGTYCGYWCLAGAAVIKIMGWNPCLFAGTEYCPADLLL